MEIAPCDAGAMILAVRWGFMSTDEVITYADDLIERAQNPSAEICELAVAISRTRVEEILGQFDTQGDRLANLKAIIFRIIDLTQFNDQKRHSFLNNVATELEYDDPKPWSDFKFAEHELEAAIAGVYGSIREIEPQMVELIYGMA